MTLDTQRQRETPEGVTLTFPVAGPSIRFYAWLLDFLILALVQAVLGTFLGLLGPAGLGAFFICYFVLNWFYPVYFEVWSGGSTPGKKVMGLEVIHDDGTPVGLSASVVRNLLRAADVLPFLYATGLVTMLLDRDFRRLGDLAAGTLVIHREKPSLIDEVPREAPLAPPFPLLRTERRALVDFASRLPRWNPERAGELATVARPLTGEGGGRSAARLVGMANWILGRSLEPEQGQEAEG
ncbi:MAG: RDD family protein [Acidobacteriota bacterium]